ncbi:MAG: hypothetical protein ABR951_02100 [Candidatus Aminicenantales bacterium]|jgi:hypothetical protein
MKHTASTLKILAVLAGFLVIAACNPIEKADKSSSMLIVESITGTLSDGTTTASYLESDVSKTTSDTATATLTASLKDPSGGVSGPSQYNNVTLTGYTIDYFLPDGTGVAGVTVPASLDGTCSTLLITIGASSTLTFVAVLNSAKLVAPLAALMGTANRLQVLARITFKGQDGTNHALQATGQLSIIFGDYATSPSSKATIRR